MAARAPEYFGAMMRAVSGRNGAARLLVALLALACIIQAVRLVFAIVTPTGPVGDWQPRSATAPSPAERIALFQRFDPFNRRAVAASGPGAVTGLPLQLFGVRINQGAGTGSAIIAGQDGVQLSVGVGEEIQPGVRLAAVHFDHVEIDNAGVRELLYLDQGQGAGAANGPAANSAATPAPVATPVPAAAPAPIPISPASVRAGVGFAPRMEGNRVTGIAVRELGDGTAFQAAGFRPGDIIRSVNGRPVASAADANALLGQIRPGARLSLEVERGTGTVPIAILVPAGSP